MAKQLPTLQESNIITASHLPQEVNFRDGLMMLIDKPKDWTSFDVVNKLRYKVKYKLGVKKIKVGHAGTLDPMATGLLIVCIGKYTKLIDTFSTQDKSYGATVMLGATTASYDAETDRENICDTDHITPDQVLAATQAFLGDQMQVPPIYSAIKIDGQAAYKLARRGKDVEMKARPVTIHKMDLTKVEIPELMLDIHCTKGTYIRSIAHDLGQQLGVGGYLTALCRTSIQDYQLDQALSLESAVNWIEQTTALDEIPTQ